MVYLPQNSCAPIRTMTHASTLSALFTCLGLSLGSLQAQDSDASSTAELGPSLKGNTTLFPIGVGTDWGVSNRPEDARLLKHHFDIITPENCMKSTKVQKEEGVWDFEKADKLVKWSQDNAIDLCGHCLIWARPGTTPAWFFKEGDQEVSYETLDQRLKTHIQTVVGRYKGKIAMWDVVNEALADRDDEYLRDNPWCNIMGEDFLVKAFQYAREADPDALLVYNDYRCDHPGKLQKLVRLLSSLKAKGAPIDALGLQAHYEYGMIPYEGIEAAIQAMRELDIKIVFSELDMDVTTRARWFHKNGAFRGEMKSFDPYKKAAQTMSSSPKPSNMPSSSAS